MWLDVPRRSALNTRMRWKGRRNVSGQPLTLAVVLSSARLNLPSLAWEMLTGETLSRWSACMSTTCRNVVIQLQHLPDLFTAAHLRQLAWYGSSDLLPFAQDFVASETPGSPPSTVANLLDRAFQLMHRKYPVEYVFKACLLKRLLFGKYSPRTTSCYPEFPVGDARADMLLANGNAMVFEIKSQFDNATRLESQLEEYYKCFTQVTVVAEDGHEEKYLDQLPDYVGVTTLTPRFSLKQRRPPKNHQEELEHPSLFRILRKAERQFVANELGVSLSHLHPRFRYQRLLEHFTSGLSIRRAHQLVVSALRQRQRTESLAARCKRLPESLAVAAFSYRLRQRDWAALVDVLDSQPGNPQPRSSHVLPLPARQAGGGVSG